MRVVRISSDLLAANGIMVELKSKSTRVIPAAKTRKGEVIQSKLIPQLRMAVISWPRESKPKVSKCGHQDGQWCDLEGNRRSFEQEICQDVEPAGIVAQETADFFEEVDHEINGHESAEAHREDFGVFAKQIAEENGHGLLAAHDRKPHNGGDSENDVGYPGPGKGRQGRRRDQELAGDI